MNLFEWFLVPAICKFWDLNSKLPEKKEQNLVVSQEKKNYIQCEYT